MKHSLLFAAISLGLTAGAALVLGVAFDGPAEQRAVWLSAAIAYAVQLLAFALARFLRRDNVKALGLPPSAALISLVIYFFVTTLIEPLFLAS